MTGICVRSVIIFSCGQEVLPLAAVSSRRPFGGRNSTHSGAAGRPFPAAAEEGFPKGLVPLALSA